MADLHDLTALEQGGLVRRREVSPLELTEHYLERADRLDSVGAFVTLTPEQARSRAAGLPAAMSSGSSGSSRCRRSSASRPRSRTST